MTSMAPEVKQTAKQGRAAQRNRTRKAIVDAAMRLMAGGHTPSVNEVIEAAQVSRRTIYMYFPTFEHLLLDATLGALAAATIEPAAAAAPSRDAAKQIEKLSRAVNAASSGTMHLGRALIRLTIDAAEPPDGAPRRGYRRVGWIERVLEPVRGQMTKREFERLVSALSVLMGWEAMVILQDVRGLGPKEAEDVLAFASRAAVDAALRGARRPARRRADQLR